MLNLELEVGDWATWVGSIGTIGAFIVAFWQIHRERSARTARDAHESWMRRREHVDRVSAWVHDGALHINNGSGHPIHDVFVDVDGQELRRWGLLPPGAHRDNVVDQLKQGALRLVFTDVRGDRWRRLAGGHPELMKEPETDSV